MCHITLQFMKTRWGLIVRRCGTGTTCWRKTGIDWIVPARWLLWMVWKNGCHFAPGSAQVPPQAYLVAIRACTGGIGLPKNIHKRTRARTHTHTQRQGALVSLMEWNGQLKEYSLSDVCACACSGSHDALLLIYPYTQHFHPAGLR